MASRKKSGKPGRKSRAKKPWSRPAPKGARHRKLAPAAKAKAKARAKRAGRPYPNLVDNMRAASAKPRARSRSRNRG